MNKPKKLPELPTMEGSSQIVGVLDKIRFELDKIDETGKFAEFCWFIREYPRAYRYHLECAEYRLENIYSTYSKAYDYFATELKTAGRTYGMAYSNEEISVLYWEFDSFLSAINSALDLMARILGTAYSDHMPVSFNKICKKDAGGPIDELKRAKRLWVDEMKDYRDCFVRYTPVDTMLNISALYSDGWEIRAKIPTNPNVRKIIHFTYSSQADLLKYSISVYKNMMELDKTIAQNLYYSYKKNEYPKRIHNLFSIGVRERHKQ